MKKRYSIALSLIITSLVLTSCSGELAFLPYENYIEPKVTKQNFENDVYVSKDHYESLSYEKYDKSTANIETYRDLYNSRPGEKPYLNMSGTGEQKLLVIPVSFSNSDTSKLNPKRAKIQNAFFGKESTTSYESVASFYNKSSYGHLKLMGKVSEWFDLGMTPEELKTNIHPSSYGSSYVASKAVEWYAQNNDDLADFDTDEDGYIDGIFLIYDTAHEQPNDLFWAYTDRMQRNLSFRTNLGQWQYLNTGEIAINGYSWASIDFSDNRGNLADSHVYSHETGHLFGLLDYYSPHKYQPVGYMDLMDSNIGDHTGWSKMILNWLTPNVLKGPGEISIKPFQEKGELILIPAGEWNGTPYDEFLLLEFYTPTGLNKYDINLKFEYEDAAGKKKTGSLFTEPGLKVYHVDARLGYFKNSITNPALISSFDDPNALTKLQNYRDNDSLRDYFVDFLNDNRVSNPATQKPLYHLLERSGNNSFVDGFPATNETLFKNGDSFGKTAFKDFAFNNGATLDYSFEITRLTNDVLTIYFKTK